MIDFGNRAVCIKSLVGSWASNLQTPTSDKDWKYFVIPTFDDLYTGKMFSSANVSDTLDYDCHDIRQLGNLLWKSNINFIITLFSPEYTCNPDLQWIFNRADVYASMNLPAFYNATMGMHFEKMKKLLQPTSNTQVLMDKFGYDTKQACHAMRCLLVLKRVSCGMSMRNALWFNGNDREFLISIKGGKWSHDDFKKYVFDWREEHKDAIKAWFSNQIVHEELSQELNQGIKTFIRINL
jgi:predicted nucleotidyltransferase